MVLRLMGAGLTTQAIADELRINRKTITRWRASLEGFDEACSLVIGWARLDTEGARGEIDKIVASWTPGGLVFHEQLREVVERVSAGAATPQPAREVDLPVAREREAVLGPEAAVAPELLDEPELGEVAPEPAEPEVINRDGRLVVRYPAPGSSGPTPAASADEITGLRPPTPAEWLAKLAAIAENQAEPPQVRVVAMGCVSSALFGGPHSKMPSRQSESAPSPAAEAAEREARQRGRDAGVPASVWQEARANFLGPAPEPNEASGEREQVEPEASTA